MAKQVENKTIFSTSPTAILNIENRDSKRCLLLEWQEGRRSEFLEGSDLPGDRLGSHLERKLPLQMEGVRGNKKPRHF
jgi:hypothetical protein